MDEPRAVVPESHPLDPKPVKGYLSCDGSYTCMCLECRLERAELVKRGPRQRGRDD